MAAGADLPRPCVVRSTRTQERWSGIVNGSAHDIRIEKWPFAVLGAFAVAIAIAGILLDRYQQAAVIDSRYAELTSIGQLKVSQISSWRAEREADGQLFSRGSVVADFAELPRGWSSIANTSAMRPSS
jgi:hypothetical protein